MMLVLHFLFFLKKVNYEYTSESKFTPACMPAGWDPLLIFIIYLIMILFP